MGVGGCGEELERCHLVFIKMRVWEEGRKRDALSSMYQLHGSSTRVFSVGGSGLGSGFIHVVAET